MIEKKKIELYCQVHHKIIDQISQTFNCEVGYTRCKDCNLNQQNLMAFDKFIDNVEKYKEQVQLKEQAQQANLSKISKPLIQCIENFQIDFEALKKQILLNIKDIPNLIKRNYSDKLPFCRKVPSLSALQETCKTLSQILDFSNSQQIQIGVQHVIRSIKEKENQFNYFLETNKVLERLFKIYTQYTQLTLEILKKIKSNVPCYEAKINTQLSYDSRYSAPTMVLNNELLSPTLAIGIPYSITLFKVQESNTLKEIQKIQTTFTPKSLYFSEDDKLLVSIENDTQIHFFEKKDDKYQQQSRLYFQQCQSINSLLISKRNDEIITNCGNLLYFISLDRVLQKRQYKVLEEGKSKHKQTINQISYNYEQDKLISGGQDKVIIWQKKLDKENNISTWAHAYTLKLKESVLSCCFITDNQFIVQCYTDRCLRIFQKDDKENYVETNQLTLDSSSKWECNNQQFKYDMNTKLLVVKGNKVIYLIYNQGKQNRLCIEQKIYGKFVLANSNNHYHIALWNVDTQSLQIYKPEYQKKGEKFKFEKSLVNEQQKQLNIV